MTYETLTNKQNQYFKLYQLFLQQRYIEEVLSAVKDTEYIEELNKVLSSANPDKLTIKSYGQYKKTYTKQEYRVKHPRKYFHYTVELLIEFPGIEPIHKLSNGNFVYLSKEFSTFTEIEDLIKLRLKVKEHNYKK